ncbi:transmembrane protein, putative (macronuclear) [Tetrahymena thermophila SB210]|uniref:Transmembrane protein, putative n=1 Tax=Tetrahymena thermophila (strain SB210) TaxID=312017 RepID=W7X8G4_TETTS|nr:transmembrane protein, putative [Tetrahymena thermophila SB210]EWS72698.1 transmembrane protein, putative [Tetrahymena thermophila SB210]|eukprot:XP_012654774.1 transmembrane protein, putative [Tetrahymena thermophila SB210]
MTLECKTQNNQHQEFICLLINQQQILSPIHTVQKIIRIQQKDNTHQERHLNRVIAQEKISSHHILVQKQLSFISILIYLNQCMQIIYLYILCTQSSFILSFQAQIISKNQIFIRSFIQFVILQSFQLNFQIKYFQNEQIYFYFEYTNIPDYSILFYILKAIPFYRQFL